MLRDSNKPKQKGQALVPGLDRGLARHRARAKRRRWDNMMRKESAAAALYQTWREQVDVEASAGARLRNEGARRGRTGQGSEDSRRRRAPIRARWRWGRIHASVFKHPLVSAFDLPAVERDGGADTVNATGAVYRLITDFRIRTNRSSRSPWNLRSARQSVLR